MVEWYVVTTNRMPHGRKGRLYHRVHEKWKSDRPAVDREEAIISCVKAVCEKDRVCFGSTSDIGAAKFFRQTAWVALYQ